MKSKNIRSATSVCFIVALSVILTTGWCQSEDETADAIVFEYEVPNRDGYKFKYNTSNGIERSENGSLTEENGEFEMKVEESYQYTRPDGKLHSVKYTADKNGFRPTVSNTTNVSTRTLLDDGNTTNVSTRTLLDEGNTTNVSTRTLLDDGNTTNVSTRTLLDDGNTTNVSTRTLLDDEEEQDIIDIRIGSALQATLAGGGLG